MMGDLWVQKYDFKWKSENGKWKIERLKMNRVVIDGIYKAKPPNEVSL
jgi:hypothetical protein